MQYSIIQKSQLEGAHRLDAEYYQPEYLEVTKILKKYKPLKDFASDIIHPQEIKREYSEDGCLFVLSQNLRENYLDFSNKFYISNDIAKQISKNLLDEGDIVTVRTGNIGLSAVISGFEKKVYASADIIVIKNPKVLPFYVSTFLNSKFGRLYLNRIIYGALQPHITPKLLGEIPIPLPDEISIKNIHKLVETALENFRQSEFLYSQAEDLLLEELGLKDFEVKDDLFYIINLSEVKSAHRADAEYFQPKYDKLVEKIKSKNAEILGELVSMKKGIEPGAEAYQDEGKLFIRVSSLSKYGIDNKDQKYLSEGLYQKLKNNYEPKVGEILLTKDATPGIAYVMKSQIEGIISSGILRLKVKNKEIENEYLALCLNSILGQMQSERDGGGSIITHWRPEQIKSILIPVLPKPTQQKIANLVQKSHEARSKAKQLLEEAKQKVENLIEVKS
jgi:type I restriction enzyme S subunit